MMLATTVLALAIVVVAALAAVTQLHQQGHVRRHQSERLALIRQRRENIRRLNEIADATDEALLRLYLAAQFRAHDK